MDNNLSLKELLSDEFEKRRRKNPTYSLRTFSQSLDVDHSTLSKIIRGKRKTTRKMVVKAAKELHLDSEITTKLLENILSDGRSIARFSPLSFDHIKILAEWFHYAIFELVNTKNFDPHPKAIALQLDITIDEAKDAVERLKRVGLIEENSSGSLKQASKNITTFRNEFTTPALKLLQKKLMERSLRALEEIPLELRDHSGMTMSINSKYLKEVKLRIKNFRRALCDEFQVDTERDSVYQLAVSFFPLTKMDKELE